MVMSLPEGQERCRGRCWFSRYGSSGYRLPYCERCGAPNPKWAKERPDMLLMVGPDEVAALEAEAE